jgi:hypothetical protein
MKDEQNKGKGLNTYLRDIPDPRRRQGRIYRYCIIRSGNSQQVARLPLRGRGAGYHKP